MRPLVGGCVVSGVADRMPEHIRALVYLDAFVLEDGENQMQHLTEMQSHQFREGVKNLGRLEGAADSCGSIQRERRRPRVGGSAMHWP